MPNQTSRRTFLHQTAAGVAAPYIISSGVLAAEGRKGPNDKINVAVIGVGSQGTWNSATYQDRSDWSLDHNARVIALG